MPHKWATRNAAVLALVLSAVANTILVVVIVTLNTHRIDDITQLRNRDKESARFARRNLEAGLRVADIRSCRRTYEGVRQIFLPFTAPLADDARARGRVRKFNARIDELKNGCEQQTSPTREVAP